MHVRGNKFTRSHHTSRFVSTGTNHYHAITITHTNKQWGSKILNTKAKRKKKKKDRGHCIEGLSLATVPFPMVRKATPWDGFKKNKQKQTKYGLNTGFTMCITVNHITLFVFKKMHIVHYCIWRTKSRLRCWRVQNDLRKPSHAILIYLWSIRLGQGRYNDQNHFYFPKILHEYFKMVGIWHDYATIPEWWSILLTLKRSALLRLHLK